MQVIDHQSGIWLLFEDSGKLLFDVLCNHSAIGYAVMIELNAVERAGYEGAGSDYLNTLAQQIQNSAPIAKGSKSVYRGRDVSDAYSDMTAAAVKRFRAKEE